MRTTPHELTVGPRGSSRADRAAPADRAAAAKKNALAPERLRVLWPDIWALIKPRRGLFAIGFVLMVINRISGMVLPASTKFVIDDVIGRRQVQLLVPIVLAVVAATL